MTLEERHSEANAEESSAEKRFWILHYVQDDGLCIFRMTCCMRHSEANAEESSASCIAIQEMTGFLTTFGMTRTRNAWNDEDAVLYSAENDEVAKKKEDSTFVESSFCGCQDSNLEPFGS